MPQQLTKMRIRDPFVMNEDTVNYSVWKFLSESGFTCLKPLKGKEQGVDVLGEKAGWKIYVESKGSQANSHDANTVFDQGQIKVHTYNQVGKLMEYINDGIETRLYVMANPDIPRIRQRAEKVAEALDALKIIRFWVQEDSSIKVEVPACLEEQLRELNLIIS